MNRGQTGNELIAAKQIAHADNNERRVQKKRAQSFWMRI